MDDLASLVVAMGRINTKTHRELRTVVRVTGLEAVGVMRAESPVDTGTLRSSTFARFSVMGDAVDVGPSVNYAPFVAYGTRRQAPNPFDLRTLQRVGPAFEARCSAIVEGLL